MASHTISSLLIQINSQRRNNNAFTSVIYNALHLISRCSNNRVLSWMKGSRISSITGLCATHQARKPFYITLCRQKNLVSQENYVSESHQAMTRMLRPSKVGPFCDRMVSYGRVTLINLPRNLSTKLPPTPTGPTSLVLTTHHSPLQLRFFTLPIVMHSEAWDGWGQKIVTCHCERERFQDSN